MTGHLEPLLFLGGNLTLAGLNEIGDEQYWNITSDIVTAMALSDIDGDENNELIVGTSDNIIRVNNF